MKYTLNSVQAALRDPDWSRFLSVEGDLFPALKGKPFTTEQIANALASRSPQTGQPMRQRINRGTRQEGSHRVSNVCHGFDIPLSVHKSLSVAALVFKDQTVLETVVRAFAKTGAWLTRRADRRVRKGGANETVATGIGAAFVLPEFAARCGQPDLHAHPIIPNVTHFHDGERVRYCAVHFGRIAKLAATARSKMNRQIEHSLRKSGYRVECIQGICSLPSVPPQICAAFSPVSQQLSPAKAKEGWVERSPERSKARKVEDAYFRFRPKKEFLSLSERRARWTKVLSTEVLALEQARYEESKLSPKQPAGVDSDSVTAVDHPLMPSSGKRESIQDGDDVLAPVIAASPIPKRLSGMIEHHREILAPMRALVSNIEITYSCPEAQPDLVVHTDALRTILRMIFPGLIVHQRFALASCATVSVNSATDESLLIEKLLGNAAAAFESELKVVSREHQLPAVMRWLHGLLASSSPKAPRSRQRSATKAPRLSVCPSEEQLKSAARVPTPVPSDTERINDVSAADKEVEILP